MKKGEAATATLSPPEKAELLRTAVRHGQVENIKALVEKGANLADCSSWRIRWAFEALINNHSEKFDAITALGCHPDYTDSSMTATACAANKPELIRQFIKTAEQQNIALRYAIEKKNQKLFDDLLALKPEIEDKTIIKAVKEKQLGMVQALIEAGANTKTTNLTMIAAIAGSLEIYDLLISQGCDRTATRDNQNIPTYLLNNYLNNYSNNPLTLDQIAICRQYESKDINVTDLKALAQNTCSQHGIAYFQSLKLTERGGFDFQLFLGHAFESAMNEDAAPEVFSWIIDAGVDFEKMPVTGRLRELDYNPTLVHAAAIRGCGNAIPFLKRHGFDLNVRTTNGYAPLHFAESLQVITALCKHGADPNALSSTGLTPMHILLRKAGNTTKITALTYVNNFNSNHTDKRGNNYLHLLMTQEWVQDITAEPKYEHNQAKNDDKKVELEKYIKCLTDGGVKINGKNVYGATPLDVAPTPYIKALLEKFGGKACHQFTAPDTANWVSPVTAPDETAYANAVKDTKKQLGIKSIKMLGVITNPARAQMLQCFFKHPVIRDFMRRPNIQFDDKRKPVLHKYEVNFYRSTNPIAFEIPYRCEPSDLSEIKRDERNTVLPRDVLEKFYHSGTSRLVTNHLNASLKRKLQQLNNPLVRLIIPGDIYGVPKKLDIFANTCEANEGFQFIVMPMIKDVHAYMYCAVFDAAKKETVAVFHCNSWQKDLYYHNLKRRVNMGRAEDKHFLVIDAAHDLQTQEIDGCCSLYTFNFSAALLQAFSESAELRTTLTQFSKQQLSDDPEKCKVLANALREAMKPHLPQYYQADVGGGFSRRDFNDINQHHLDMRWKTGNEVLQLKLSDESATPHDSTPG